MDIEFIATLSGSSAIKFSAEGDTKVQFEMPESELASVLGLVRYKGKAFKVTISEV